MTDREVPLDAETYEKLGIARRLMYMPPWAEFFGKTSNWTVGLALGYAEGEGFKPDSTFRPPYSRMNGKSRPLYKVHTEVDGGFDGLDPTDIGSILRQSLRHYIGPKPPESRYLDQRGEEQFDLPESMVREIGALAFKRRRTAVEQGSLIVDAIVPRIMASNPPAQEKERTVYFQPEPKSFGEMRLRVLDRGLSLNPLIVSEIRRLLDSGKVP